MPGNEDLPVWGGGGRGHGPPYGRDRGERIDRVDRGRRDFPERPPGFARNVAPIGPPQGAVPLKRRGPGRPYVYGEARYGPPGMRGAEVGPAPFLEQGPPPPVARRPERDAFYAAGSPPYGPAGDFARRDIGRDAGYGPEVPGEGPVGRGAFYRDRGDAVARDLEGGPGWQAREPPPPMPLRDFRERDRVRSLDRGYRRPGFAAAPYGPPPPRDNRVDRFGREWLPDTTRRPPSTSDELPPVDWKSLAELPSPREGSGARELPPREVGGPGLVAREVGPGYREGLGARDGGFGLQEGPLVAREGFGLRDPGVPSPVPEPLYARREGALGSRDGFGGRDLGPLSARESPFALRDGGAALKDGPCFPRDRMGPSAWRTGMASPPGSAPGKGGPRDREDLPPRREGPGERIDFSDQPGPGERRGEDRPALFERLAGRPGRALDRTDRSPGVFISPPPHPDFLGDKPALDKVSPRGLSSAKVSPRSENRPSPRSSEAAASPRRPSEAAPPKDSSLADRAARATPTAAAPVPSVAPVVASLPPFSSPSPLEPSMSGQSSEQRPGERPRPRLGWGQGLVAFERVKPKDEEEQVSSARRSSGADVGPESVGVSPAVSEDKSAAHTVEPEGGVVNSVQKHPEESSGAPLVEVAVAESNHKPVVPSPATPDSGKLVDLLLKSAVSDALALNGEANAPKTQPAQVFPLEPQAPTAKAEMVTPKVGKSSPWPQSLSALTEKEGPVKPESTAWPQSLSALTEKEGVAKPREAAPKEVPVPSAELVPATTEATPAVKVSPWPQSLSAAMGLVPAPEGLAPIKTLRLEEQLAAGTSDAGAAKPVNPSDSIPTSPLSPTFPQPSKEEPPAFPLGASTQPMTFSSLVGSSLPEHSLRSPFGDAARLTSPYQDTPRRSYLDSRPYGASPGLFSSVFHRSDSGSLGLGVAAWKPEDYLRTDAGFRKDGVAELGEGARAGSLGRTPSEATKLKDAVLASLGESGGVLESGQKTPPPQARAEPSEKSEEQASPMQVDESAAAEGSAEGERRTEGEEEEELGGTEKPGERAARETGGPGEPSKDVILSEMEQVDSEIERLEKQLSRMASLEKSGTMASTPTAQALAEATGIVGVQAEAMKGAQEGEKPEGLSRETGDGQVTGSKQPADGTGLEKEEGPTEEEGPEEGGEAAVEEGPAKGRTPKASEGPPSSKAGSLKWKWAAAGNGNLPLDTSAGKHESEAAAQETPVEEAAAKPEEDAAEVKEAAPAVQVKWEFNPLALGGPDPFLKFEQIIASQDGLARYLAEQHPAPPRAVAKVEPKADELILSAGCQDRAVFVQARIWANREAARRSEAGLQHLLPAGCQLGDGPLYTCPEEAPYWRTNEEAHARIEEALLTRLQEKKRDLQFTEHVLALRYRFLRALWRQELEGVPVRPALGKARETTRLSKDKAIRRMESGSDRKAADAKAPPKSSQRFRPGGKLDPEELQIVSRLLAEPGGEVRGHLKMTPMILTDEERAAHKFVTRNALVRDPVQNAAMHKLVNPWTDAERKLFLEKYTMYNKNFKKIASFLEHKSTADCIRFYYLHQKSEDFDKVRRRQQLKKRRDYRGNNSFMGVHALAGTTGRRDREANAARVEALPALTAVMKESSKAARRAMDRGKPPSMPADVERGSQSKVAAAAVSAVVRADRGGLLDTMPGDAPPRKKKRDKLKFRGGPPRPEQSEAPVVGEVDADSGAASEGVVKRVSSKGARSNLGRKERPWLDTGTPTGAGSEERVLGLASPEDPALQWTDLERQTFVAAIREHGKEFAQVAARVGTKSTAQCKAFFSKSRKRLGLDRLLEERSQKGTPDAGPENEGAKHNGAAPEGGTGEKAGVGSESDEDRTIAEVASIKGQGSADKGALEALGAAGPAKEAGPFGGKVSNEELKRELQLGLAKVQEKAAILGRKEQEVKASAQPPPPGKPPLIVKPPSFVAPALQKSPTSLPGGADDELRAAMTLLEAKEGLSDSADEMEMRPLGEVLKRKGSLVGAGGDAQRPKKKKKVEKTGCAVEAGGQPKKKAGKPKGEEAGPGGRVGEPKPAKAKPKKSGEAKASSVKEERSGKAASEDLEGSVHGAPSLWRAVLAKDEAGGGDGHEVSLMATEGSLSGSDKEGEEGGEVSAQARPAKGAEKKAKQRTKKAPAEADVPEAETFTALLAGGDSDESSGEPILGPGKQAPAAAAAGKKKDGGDKTPGERKIAVWTQEEKDRFGEMMTRQGKKKDWEQLQEAFPNKTLQQLRTHFQNSKAKRLKELEREAQQAEKDKERHKDKDKGERQGEKEKEKEKERERERERERETTPTPAPPARALAATPPLPEGLREVFRPEQVQQLQQLQAHLESERAAKLAAATYEASKHSEPPSSRDAAQPGGAGSASLTIPLPGRARPMTPPPAPSQAHPAPGSRAPPQKKRKLEDEQPEMGGTNVVPPRQESAPAFVATPSFLGKGAIRGEEQPARSAGGTSGFAALLQGAGPGGGSSGGGGPKPGGLANPFLQASARPAADVSEQQRQLALLMQLMPQANAMGGPAAFPPGMFPPFLFPGMMPMLMGGLGQGGIPPQMAVAAAAAAAAGGAPPRLGPFGGPPRRPSEQELQHSLEAQQQMGQRLPDDYMAAAMRSAAGQAAAGAQGQRDAALRERPSSSDVGEGRGPSSKGRSTPLDDMRSLSPPPLQTMRSSQQHDLHEQEQPRPAAAPQPASTLRASSGSIKLFGQSVGPQSSPPQQPLRPAVHAPVPRSSDAFRGPEGLSLDRPPPAHPLHNARDGVDRRGSDDRKEDGRAEPPFWAPSAGGGAGWGRPEGGPSALPHWMVEQRPAEHERGGGPRTREEANEGRSSRGAEGAASPMSGSSLQEAMARLLALDPRAALPDREREGGRHGGEGGGDKKGHEAIRMAGDSGARLKSEASGMLRDRAGLGGERRPLEGATPGSRGGGREMGAGGGGLALSDGPGGMSMDSMRTAYEAMAAAREAGGSAQDGGGARDMPRNVGPGGLPPWMQQGAVPDGHHAAVRPDMFFPNVGMPGWPGAMPQHPAAQAQMALMFQALAMQQALQQQQQQQQQQQRQYRPSESREGREQGPGNNPP